MRFRCRVGQVLCECRQGAGRKQECQVVGVVFECHALAVDGAPARYVFDIEPSTEISPGRSVICGLVVVELNLTVGFC